MVRESVLGRLASSLGRRDEVPNLELAKDVARSYDRAAVKELVQNLSNKDVNIQTDCIKVLYEVGEREPRLTSDYVPDFGRLLSSKNKRLVWGAMTALDTVTSENPEQVYDLLPIIMEAAERGLVIARDHAVGISIGLSRNQKCAAKSLPLLLNQLRTCPENQLPIYAEMSVSIINQGNKKGFSKVIEDRMGRLKKDSQKRRFERLLRKVNGQLSPSPRSI